MKIHAFDDYIDGYPNAEFIDEVVNGKIYKIVNTGKPAYFDYYASSNRLKSVGPFKELYRKLRRQPLGQYK